MAITRVEHQGLKICVKELWQQDLYLTEPKTGKNVRTVLLDQTSSSCSQYTFSCSGQLVALEAQKWHTEPIALDGPLLYV